MANPIKWHGGKTYLAAWIREHFPNDETYTHRLTTHAGGLGVLLAGAIDGKYEAVNDLNAELATFWRVIRDANEFGEFSRRVSLTEFSQAQFEQAKSDSDDETRDDVSRAVSFFVRYRMSRQGLGKCYATPTRRLRRQMNENVSAYLSAVDGLAAVHERLARVEVRNMDAVAFIRAYDHDNAFFYLDPPYMHATRTATDAYEYEMSADDHSELLETLAGISGQFLLSGYHSPLYDEWQQKNRVSYAEKRIDNKSSGAAVKPVKTEVIWANYNFATGKRRPNC